MYLDFFKLHLKPFQISTDPKFLWLGEKHKEALAVLKYGILDNKGFLLLTGDVGTGKTTLLNALIDSLGDDVLVALVTDPGLAKMDFFNFVADSFEMDKNFKSKGEFLIFLKNYLLGVHRQNKRTLLIIDECQHLNQKLLEEVRLLSNIEKFNTKLINIFFVGQSEFNNIILRPRNRAIRQRITINYNISALSESEMDKYIRFRLKVAGSKEEIFTSRAIKAIFKFSNGYPRLINIICDQALLTGYVKEKRKIDEKIVTECASELKISYGTAIKESLATPEAADAKPVDASSSAGAIVTDVEQKRRQFSKPLVIAFIVVVIIWGGLVALFILNQQQSVSFDRKGGLPVAADRTAFPQKSAISPGGADESTSGMPATIRPEANGSLDGDSANRNKGSNVAAKQASMQTTPSLPPPSTQAGEAAPSLADNRVKPNHETEKQPSAIASAGKTGEAGRITLQDITEKFGALPAVHFGFNSNKLDRESLDILELIARYCTQNPETAIVLRGYTDRSGVRAYNLKLSEFRADMVKTYLVGKGVKASSINAIGMGPEAVKPGGEEVADEESQRKVVIEIISPNG